MQEVLDRLLKAEKEGEQIIAEARSAASSRKSESDSALTLRLKEEKERLRLRLEKELSELTEREEETFRKELARLEAVRSSLTTDAGKDKEGVLENLKALICASEIG